jgi:26S proteasome regulatory subunit N5
MVEQTMGWLEEIRKREGDEKWLELVETLRGVTEGKVSHGLFKLINHCQ